MVQGTSSWAGKSLLVTALARYFARIGVRVAPFKAQNMSNNARVACGGEIGTAQWLQARAAGVEPDVRMNPVLVKPEGDDRSQVVLLGKPDAGLSRLPWRQRAEETWPAIVDSLSSLLDEFDLVVIEGAGSPAEFNLWDCDVANMRVAHAAGASVLIVTDIDRGGAFAHLFGTWSLLPEHDRELVRGFVLNKFRGDPSLLTPAPEELERLTGVPVLGVIPWLDHDLPDEDGAAIPRNPGTGPLVAIVRYPTASNLDEFKPLERFARVTWARAPGDLTGADLVVLPGSKHVASDLAWLREREFAEALVEWVDNGKPLLAICGGLQMLGERVDDPFGVDGKGPGLALMPLTTVFEAEKTTSRTRAAFGSLAPPWDALSHRVIDGYEIRHGKSAPTGLMTMALPGGAGYAHRSILGLYVHGLFENDELTKALFGSGGAPSADATFDRLADAIAAHVDTASLHALVGVP
jgi:adenosylcobyric acid synthase